MKKVDAEVFFDKTATKEDLQSMEPVSRTRKILEIYSVEKLIPEQEGVALNEGYQYEVNSSIPQLADALSKLASELDNAEDMGDGAGKMFLSLINEYYEKIKSGE